MTSFVWHSRKNVCGVSAPRHTIEFGTHGGKTKASNRVQLEEQVFGGLTVGPVVSSAYTAPKIEPIEQAGRGQVH